MSYRILNLAFLCMGLCTVFAPAKAQTVVGGSLFITASGDVTATYLGNSASYDDRLYLASPFNSLGQIFFNHGDPVGTVKDLGFFTAGTKLTFRLHVDNTNNDFFSGNASLNPDNHAHAQVTYNYTPTSTLVEFEDLFGGPYVYNDLRFTFSNVQQAPPAVPEPGNVALLLSISVVCTGILVRRHKAAKIVSTKVFRSNMD